MLRIRIRDPGSGAFLTPGSGKGKKSGSGMNIPDYSFESLETTFWYKILKFLDADADPDPELGNLFDPGFWVWDGKIEIRDPG